MSRVSTRLATFVRPEREPKPLSQLALAATRFDALPQRRSIVDRRVLADRLATLPDAAPELMRRAATRLLKDALLAGRAEVDRRLLAQPSRGLEAANAQAFLHDQILRLLAAMPAKVFTRDAIIDRLHGPGFAVTDRTIDSHVRNLRAKFARVGAGDVIETRAGVGYSLGACASA